MSLTNDSRKSEITQLHHVLRRQQNVLRLYIPVNAVVQMAEADRV